MDSRHNNKAAYLVSIVRCRRSVLSFFPFFPSLRSSYAEVAPNCKIFRRPLHYLKLIHATATHKERQRTRNGNAQATAKLTKNFLPWIRKVFNGLQRPTSAKRNLSMLSKSYEHRLESFIQLLPNDRPRNPAKSFLSPIDLKDMPTNGIPGRWQCEQSCGLMVQRLEMELPSSTMCTAHFVQVYKDWFCPLCRRLKRRMNGTLLHCFSTSNDSIRTQTRQRRLDNDYENYSKDRQAYQRYLPRFERTLFEAGADDWPDDAKITTLVGD